MNKAVFPVNILGTPFPTDSKSIPQGMFVVVDRHKIQNALNELVSVSVNAVILITGRDKRAVPNYFVKAYEPEHYL